MWFNGFNQNNFSSVFVKVSSSCHILLLILRTSHNQTIQVRLQGLLSWGGGLYTVGEYRDIPRPPLSRDKTRDKTRFIFIGVPGFGRHLTCSHLPRDNKLSTLTNPHRQHTVNKLSDSFQLSHILRKLKYNKVIWSLGFWVEKLLTLI